MFREYVTAFTIAQAHWGVDRLSYSLYGWSMTNTTHHVPTVYMDHFPRNSVRRYKSAELVEVAQHDVQLEDGTPATLRHILSTGNASHGYRSDYHRVQVWWVELEVSTIARRRVFGRKYQGVNAERNARADYLESVAVMASA